MRKIIIAIITDLLRNWSLWIYTLFLLASCLGLFYIEGFDQKSILSILNVILFIVPTFCLVFAILYYFNSLDFISLLLAQPIKRRTIIISFMAALSIVFVGALWVGVALPLLIVTPSLTSLVVIMAGTFLTMTCVNLSLLIGVYSREKSHGLGLSLVLLFYFILIFDGLVLLIMYMFRDYPLENLALYITFLNPIDLSRIMTLMHTDVAALMGYTGAVFQKFFNAVTGTVISVSVLSLWVIIPAWATLRKFKRKNF